MPNNSIQINLDTLFRVDTRSEQEVRNEVIELADQLNRHLHLDIDLNDLRNSRRPLEDFDNFLRNAGVSLQRVNNQWRVSTQEAEGLTHAITLQRNEIGDLGLTAERVSASRNTAQQELLRLYSSLISSTQTLNNLEAHGLQNTQAYSDASQAVAHYNQEINHLVDEQLNLGVSNASLTRDRERWVMTGEADIAVMQRQREYTLQQIQTTHQATTAQNAQTEAYNNYIRTLKQLYQAEENLHKAEESGSSTPEYLQALRTQVNTLQQQTRHYRDLSTQLGRTQRQEEELLNTEQKHNVVMQQGTIEVQRHESVWANLKARLTNIVSYGAGYRIFNEIIQYAQKSIETLKELDASLVNLQIAMGSNRESAKQLLSQYSQLAQEIGATTTEVANSSVEWIRQGYSQKETSDLVYDSMVLSKVGMLDSAEATEYLTSAMKGYQKETSEVIGIVDKLTAIDLKAATSAGNLALGMSRTANSARIAGVSMDKLLGYLAVVQETTQKDASFKMAMKVG